jgi:hypothetical protein
MRKISTSYIVAFLLAILFAALPQAVKAQDDPPGRVARLNFIQGSVSYQVSGDQDWVQANPNRPLTTGDNLWVDKDSRGEVHIGSTAIRMSSETGISFLTLDDRTVQVQLAQGVIEVHVRNFPGGDAFEIDTPNLAFTITRPGEYRIETDPNGGATTITVREGEGEVTGGGESWELRGRQRYAFNGTDQLSYDASDASEYDDFESWCQQRDQRENGALSARYVSRDVDGYYDLDDYGDWRADSDYGQVWVPRGIAVGWAPYQVGHWVYVAPWGWTWVDDEPWGFAPFHYGRWVFVSGYWGWVPGPLVVRPVYAPALVGFVGGGGFGISVAFGGGFSGVAWFPLGPRDVYVPGYRCSPRYVQNINVTNTRVVNVTQITNVYNTVVVNRNNTLVNNYTYARNTSAVTAVSRETFVNARPVSRATVRITSEQIQNARPNESAPIAPTRASYVSSTAKPAMNKPAVPFAQRPVVARLNPAVSRPAPQEESRGRTFDQRQGDAQTNQRGAYSNNQQPTGAQEQNRNQPSPSQTENNRPPSNDGFRPFQPPPGSTNTASNTRGNGGANSNNGANNNATNSGGSSNVNSSNRPPNNNAQPQSTNSTQQQQQANNDRPAMRFSPPPKARDDMYDVHPPLNQKQAQPPPKQEEHAAPPAAEKKEQHDKAKQDDKKHDDEKH